MKMRGCIKLYRWEVNREKGLTDAELRLYLLYRRLADWDSRHKETFGTVSVSIKTLRENYLPAKNWSMGKVSGVTKGLIQKGFLRRASYTRLAVDKFDVFQATVQQAEKMFQLIEKGFQITEQNFHPAENRTPEQNLREIQKMKQNIGKTFQ